MELTRINDVVDSFSISSRTLRYYEQAGILWSTHPDNKSQRYYDDSALERLKQIIVLRKLQIPIKDIAKIYKEESTTSLIQAFVSKLDSLDKEIASMSELRRVVDEFLHKMLIIGIKKISAITLLYEETEKRLSPSERIEAIANDTKVSQSMPNDTIVSQRITFEELSKISREALKLNDVRIIMLPPMRILTSQLKTGEVIDLNGDNMQNAFIEYGFIPTPGLRNCFYHKMPGDIWLMMMKVPDSYINITPYNDDLFTGGLYAITSSFMEDLDDTFLLLRDWINNNEHFELDANDNGTLKRIEMIEEILPWNIAEKLNRYQQDVFIPIRIR